MFAKCIKLIFKITFAFAVIFIATIGNSFFIFPQVVSASGGGGWCGAGGGWCGAGASSGGEDAGWGDYGSDPFVTPAVSVTTSNQWLVHAYIASWTPEAWSNCQLTPSGWQKNWSIISTDCTQTRGYQSVGAISDIYITQTFHNGVLVSTTETGVRFADAPRTADDTSTTTAQLNLANPIANCIGKVANSTDTCSVSLTLQAVTQENRPIDNISSIHFENLTDTSGIDANRIDGDSDPTTNNAIGLSASSSVGIIDSTLTISGITSVAPVEISNWKISGELTSPGHPPIPLEITNISYNFLKPYRGVLSASKTGNSWWDMPSIGTQYLYKMNIDWALVTSTQINMPPEALTLSTAPTHIFENLNIDSATFSTKNIRFSTRINTSLDAAPLGSPRVVITPRPITYSLAGKNVKYLLSAQTDALDTSNISLSGEGFSGIKIVGQLQGNIKAAVTAGRQEAIDFKSQQSVIRDTIRKNTQILIRERVSGTTVGRVKYLEGDYTLSGTDIDNVANWTLETLIVKNWNLRILNNVEDVPKPFGIILLSDTPLTLGRGNIFIGKEVTKIRAIFYADGALISANELGEPYITDTVVRNSVLSKQLILIGSIITANTVWWATNIWEWLLLPQWNRTTDFDLAMTYDLNYFRRGNAGCDLNWNGSCTDFGEYIEPTVAIYDPKIVVQPPKGFSTR